MGLEFGRKRVFFLIAAVFLVVLLYNSRFISGDNAISRIPLPGRPASSIPSLPSETDGDGEEGDKDNLAELADSHPIATFMREADQKWRLYEGSRSTTFRQTVQKYRDRYGRHPPPGFKEWYQFARKKNVFNIDDFDQIMDDLRPFWAIDPMTIRTHAAHMWENLDHGISGIHIRNKKIVAVHHSSWRTETLELLINKVIQHLPDMDIAMNRLDQPRVVVPWDDMQTILTKEYETRSEPPEAIDSFTDNQTALLDVNIQDPDEDKADRLDAGWFYAPGKQYMDIASQACPPDSPARSSSPSSHVADSMYKDPLGGFVTNFNLSSDLCTVGPSIQTLHGMLYSASSMIPSHTLVPIFGECKVSVNSDILFPANMYYKHDPRYDYDPAEDVPWAEKSDTMIWRGVTSGGVQVSDNWQTMHRQRLVQLANGTYMANKNKTVTILTKKGDTTVHMPGTSYERASHYQPSDFANQHIDIGFVESWGCDPNCSFYDSVFALKNEISQSAQFRSKYLIDVDGHSFSGRWHAFLQSKSLGFKATIFREWHDSRLLAWRHFVPVDNRYDDLYSLLTYFIGVNDQRVHVPSHEFSARKLARQGREWANKVLRREDIEVYMFRLLLEYARICDDNRDRIGYSGDGSELDKFDEYGDASSLWEVGNWFDDKQAGD